MEYYATELLERTRPLARRQQVINAPPQEVPTADNSVQYPEGTELEVDLDTERQNMEQDPTVHWFRSARHPGGFPVAEGAFEEIHLNADAPQDSSRGLGAS
ncbi:MAG: hypothetical protein ACREIF_02205 [Chthoniobacterales bacterium]